MYEYITFKSILLQVYEYITFDSVKHVTLASLPRMQKRTIITSSLSKTFGVTGKQMQLELSLFSHVWSKESVFVLFVFIFAVLNYFVSTS